MNTTAGVLYGVGLGPGDPELVTVKAARIIGAADVVAYHSARHGRSIARSIAAPYLRGDQIEEQLVYPVTTEPAQHPGGYEAAIEEFYEQAAARLMAHLAAGRDVVLLAEGDPLFYSSYMHMHKRISSRFRTEIVPGITSVSAASAALATPLVEGDDVLTVLPGTLGRDELTRRLSGTGAAAIMKISRSYADVRQALKESGRLPQAYYVERASGGAQQLIEPAGDVDPSAVPYMSIIIVPGAEAADRPATRRTRPRGPARAATGQATGGRPGGSTWWASARPGATGSPRRRWPSWPPPTTSSGTRPTSTGSRPTRGSGGTAATTGPRRSGPSSRSTWPCKAAGSPWSPPVTRACSPWPRWCSRPPPATSGSRTCRSTSCPGSPPRRPSRARPAPRSATTT